ncbi:MFS transporter [uncultured Bacteroides sp.]|uniref:MFS transporter n=1 Tax=uncultured Bacteroides sp. TaxID=162156 RepID=UPI0025DD810D|nr:MFS transporter [uncultured Bacteroides sp.]
MVQTQTSPVRKIAYPILIALSVSHCLNDLLQSVITAVYPLLKTDLSLSFAQIGLITLVYQMSASVFQPITGLIFDKRPIAWSLPIGMTFSLVGIVSLAFAANLYWLMASVFVVGIGSSVLHPEASRITFLASGGKRGLAQSLFQVGGNLGGSLGPLMVALLVAPFGRQYVAWFAVLALIAIWVMMPICRWYRSYLNHLKKRPMLAKVQTKRPLSAQMTAFAVGVLLVLIFSKYIYMASLTSYYTFYLIHKFGVTVQQSQIYLFVFLVATAAGTLTGGPIGDKVGRKFVIWISILGTAPFSMLMPHVGLFWTVVLSFCVGFMLSSAFPAILLYAQELLPDKLGLISGLFFGFAFGIAGIASAVLGDMADNYGIEAVYNVCAFMPLLGLVAWFLPNLKKR